MEVDEIVGCGGGGLEGSDHDLDGHEEEKEDTD